MVRAYEFKERLDGKVIVITGASSGIGKRNLHTFATLGARVFVIGRNQAKTQALLDAIAAETGNKTLDFVQADLNDLASVREAALSLLAKNVPIHLLVLNAGSAVSEGLVKDGFEHLFVQNYLSHFLLTMLLLPRLKETQSVHAQEGCVRIVSVSSSASVDAPKVDFGKVKAVDKTSVMKPAKGPYGRSKLAQVLFTKKLSKELAGTGITAYSLHPGAVGTNIYRSMGFMAGLVKLFLLTEEEGALTTLYCATAPVSNLENGAYFADCAKAVANKLIDDEQHVDEVWNKTIDLLQPWLSPSMKSAAEPALTTA